jgi:MFS transporter, DHA2 family, multidrug resistance protein
MPDGAHAHDPSYAHRWIIAITVTMASVLEILDTSIVNVAIPHMMGSLGATLDQIAWVSTGYIVANVIILPVTGWMSAYFGRRRYFAGSIALFTIASVLCGNAHTLTELVVFRILQGLGGGALLSTAQATLYEVFPREEYGSAMAIFGLGVMVGPTLGPTLGGWLTDTWSWPYIFYINVPFGVLAFILSLAYVRDSRFARRVDAVDWTGLALLATGIGMLQTMLERGERLDWFSSREIVTYATAGSGALVLFVLHELRTQHPVIDLRILKNRQFATGCVVGGVLGVCLYATVFVLPVYLQQGLGFTANQTGLVILPGALATAATMAVMARRLGRVDTRPTAVFGVALFAFAMWQWSHFTLQSGRDDFFWPLIVRGVALGMVFIPLNNLAVSELPMSQIGAATGLYNLTRQLGGSIGIAISANAIASFGAQARAALAAHLPAGDPAVLARVDAIARGLAARGTPAAEAHEAALRALAAQVQAQAYMLAFERIFIVFGVAFLLAVPLILSLRWRPGVQPAAEAH